MAKGFFIIGTDTGVGKTTVSCGLLDGFANLGLRVIGMKPIATGSTGTPGDDIERLKAAANVVSKQEWINPYAFTPAISPHLAARRSGIKISVDAIAAAYLRLAQIADVVIVEGVGGFRVPLDADSDTADLIVKLDLAIVLVVGMRLGCLNHALLTVEAIKNRRLSPVAWVANRIDPDFDAVTENITTLERRFDFPLIGVLPFFPQSEILDTNSYLNIRTLDLGALQKRLID